MSSDCDEDDGGTDFAWSSTSEDCIKELDAEAKMIENDRSASFQNEDKEYEPKTKKKRNGKLSSGEGEEILMSKDMIKQESDFAFSAKKLKKKKIKEEQIKNGVDHHKQDTDNDSYLDVRVKHEKSRERKKIKDSNNDDDDKNIRFSDVSIKSEHKPKTKNKPKPEKLKQEDVTSEDDFYLKQRIKQEIRSARERSPSDRRKPSLTSRSPSPQRSPSPAVAVRSPPPRRSSSSASRSPSPRRGPSPASRSPSPRRSPSPASRSPSPRRSPSPASRSPSPRRSLSPASRSSSPRPSLRQPSGSPLPRQRRSASPAPRSQASSSDTTDSDSVSPRNDKHSTNKKASMSRNTNSTLQKSSIADKIIFENDNDASQCFHTKTIKSFLKQHPHLKVTNSKNKISIKSEDEDVWLVHCPTEVSLGDIKSIELSSEKKLLKLKVQGNSYEGGLNQDLKSVPVQLSKKEHNVIKNIALQGVINFHKRISKTDIVEKQIAPTNSSFIPLPATKCRHPLFGPNYKSASKIPKAIIARLQAASNSIFEYTVKKKKKKPKKRKADQDEIGPADEEQDAAPAPPSLSPPRKRRREGRADSDHSGAKRAKSRKHAETEPSWESERGIEESLFNY